MWARAGDGPPRSPQVYLDKICGSSAEHLRSSRSYASRSRGLDHLIQCASCYLLDPLSIYLSLLIPPSRLKGRGAKEASKYVNAAQFCLGKQDAGNLLNLHLRPFSYQLTRESHTKEICRLFFKKSVGKRIKMRETGQTGRQESLWCGGHKPTDRPCVVCDLHKRHSHLGAASPPAFQRFVGVTTASA